MINRKIPEVVVVIASVNVSAGSFIHAVAALFVQLVLALENVAIFPEIKQARLPEREEDALAVAQPVHEDALVAGAVGPLVLAEPLGLALVVVCR
jgi:hypothetical protein